jgi:hypothetical protein
MVAWNLDPLKSASGVVRITDVRYHGRLVFEIGFY